MRHFWSIYLTTLTLFLSFLAVSFWMIVPFISFPNLSWFSPLPSFLSLTSNAQVTTLSLWTPHTPQVLKQNSLNLSAQAALSYDLQTDQLLVGKNMTQRLPMASLTKIMTAIVALEHPKKDDKYLVSNSAIVGEDSMGVSPGEVYSREELLYGLVLHSGNDASIVLADNYPGGQSAFTDAMNQKAKALGLSDTNFTNPSGLQGDGTQYTTVKDLLIMTKYVLDNFPLFDKVAATVEYVIPQTATHKEIDLENETNLLTTYPGVKGVKTGYTPEAGLCLVTYLDYSGHKIIAIILNSENRRQEMKDILDYSLTSLGVTPPLHE